MQVNSIQFSHPTRKLNKTQINSVPLRDGGMKDTFELSAKNAPSFTGLFSKIGKKISSVDYQKLFSTQMEAGDYSHALSLVVEGKVPLNKTNQEIINAVRKEQPEYNKVFDKMLAKLKAKTA